jgi:diacylglycerol O-acyltransferase / wax synthase
MQQLTGLDASFVYSETPTWPMHVSDLRIYDQSTAPGGKVTFKGILRHIESRIDKVPTFRRKLVQVPFGLDHPYWVPDNDFDLEFHVRHIALPKPGDWRQLCIEAARLHSRHLDLSRPPWEMYIIEGLDNVDGVPPGSFAVFQKTHHAAIDGVASQELQAVIHDLTPDYQEVGVVAPVEQAGREPSTGEMLARAYVNMAFQPLRLAQILGRAAPNVARAGTWMTAPPATAPRTRFNGVLSPHRVLDWRRFDLSELRRIKSTVPGATINDVVISVIGGALRRYLTEKDELPDRSMSSIGPISVRSSDQGSAGGNKISMMMFTLGTDVEDPLERLRVVTESTHKAKEFANAVGARALSDFSQEIPGALSVLGARAVTTLQIANRVTYPYNTIISNIPGPQVPLYFLGARMVTHLGTGPLGDGMGLGHCVLSYNGELTINVTADRAMLPDPAHYADCIAESFDELAKAATSD